MSKTMRPTRPDRLARAAVVGLLALAGYVMLADFVNLRRAQQASIEAPVPLSDLALPQPWGGYGWRALARLAGDASRIDPETASSVLTDAGRRYPLDAVQWLDLARIHAREGEAGPVDAYLARVGAVQPWERRSLWAAAQVALQTGNAALAERQLRQWLRLYPRDTGQALFIGSRWIDDPGTLLDRMLPEGREYLAEAMEVARRQTDIPLAEAVWSRLTPKPGLDDPLFLNLVDLLLQTGDVARAVELWAERDPGYEPGFRLSEVETSEVRSARTEPSEVQPAGSGAAELRSEARSAETGSGSRSVDAGAESPRAGGSRAFLLVNGDFSRPLGEPLALNWRINRLPPGVRAELDSDEAFSGPASLRVSFNGKENVHLAEPWIRIPVVPGQHYRLSGAWRADALTTRSLPYWTLTAEQGDLRERKAVPGAKFGWERWQIEFQAPEEARLVRLQLRRDRTNAFDRNIDGTLWLDDFRLEPIAEPRTLKSAASEALGRQVKHEKPVSGFRVPVSGEKEETVYGLRFTVYGKNQGGGAADSEQGFAGAVSGRDVSSVGAGSGRDEAAPELTPAVEPATAAGDSDSLAGQAPTPVDSSLGGKDLQFHPVFAAGVEQQASPVFAIGMEPQSSPVFATGVGAGLAGEAGSPGFGLLSAPSDTTLTGSAIRKHEFGSPQPEPRVG